MKIRINFVGDDMRRKSIIALAILLMSIGFAAVSATLYLNGTIGIGTNQADFDVYFSKAVENGVENNSLIQDKTHISFRTELSKIDETYTIVYDVTNASKQYDANLVINCTESNEYLRVTNLFDITKPLKAREIRSGKLLLTVIKSVLEDVEINISCEISGSAIERDTLGGDDIDAESLDRLTYTSNSDTLIFGHSFDKSKIESISIKDDNTVPVNALDSWDASSARNGSIMAYTLDEDNDDLYELYIGQNGGVITFRSISSYLFANYSNVTSITGLENLKIVGDTAMHLMFKGCGSLVDLDLSGLDTSNITNMEGMFDGCSSLINLNLGNWNTSKVKSMRLMFNNCSSLTNLNIRSFDTSNVTNMDYMFYNCSSLIKLDLSSFDTNKVTNMSYMFYQCKSLTKLDVSQFDTGQVTDMSYMFCYCEKLSLLDVSNLDTSNVITMSFMFYRCVNLSFLNLSDFNTSNVKSMSYMFYSCSNLVSIDVSHFDTSNVTAMDSMFDGCTSLENLNLDSFDTSNVETMIRTFFNCYRLKTTITIRGNKCKYIQYHGYGIFENAATESGAQIIIHYTNDANEVVEAMLKTKSSNSNVVKGNILPEHPIKTIGNENVVADYASSYSKKFITLSSKLENQIVTSFKLNGVTINGNTFKMPDEDAFITDVVTVVGVIIESEHDPYPYNLDNKVYGENTFEGATSLTVTLNYETEGQYYDWIYLYDSAENAYGKYAGSKKTETITIPGDYIKVVFRTNDSKNNYYGFKATIIPNYD